MSKEFSQKIIQRSSSVAARRSTIPRSKRHRIYASALQPGSAEQVRLVNSRISKGLCAECGRVPASEFCRSCLQASARTVEVATPFNAWSYVVRQIRPAIPGFSAFIGERVGLYGERKGFETICVLDSFEEAKTLVLQRYKRATAVLW
jgi:hypothetical protein